MADCSIKCEGHTRYVSLSHRRSRKRLRTYTREAADSLRAPRHMAASQSTPTPARPWQTGQMARQAVTSTDSRWEQGTASALTSSQQGKKSSRGTISVNSHFDSGNIEVVEIRPEDKGTSDIDLRIHEDPFCESDKRNHFMWFLYRVTGVKKRPLCMRILNAGQASFPTAWPGYQAVCSYDRKHWFRVPTEYDKQNGCLTIQHTPTLDSAQYAFFAPYPFERHQDLIAEMQAHPLVSLEMLGETLDGHDLDLLVIGKPSRAKRKVWIIARQHPGESMAEFFAEGLLRKLLDPHDGVSRAILDLAVIYVVPNMNPDGSWRGHLRVNAAGANLNREWVSPTEERSPEVLYVWQKMQEVGCDFFGDIHGDEALPYNFLAGNEGIPGWTTRLQTLQASFSSYFMASSPDFQCTYGYGKGKAGRADMRIATHAVGQTFDCLAFTLEMPFKDTADRPEPIQGWSPERAMRFGASMLVPMLQILPHLR